MILIEYKEQVIKYIFCSIILIVIMFVLRKALYKEQSSAEVNEVITSNIVYKDATTNIDVEYPRFNENNKVNTIVTSNIFKYIKNFKQIEGEKELKIKYDLYYIDNFVNIQYNVYNSVDPITNLNLFIDFDENEKAYISSIYDEEYITNEVYNKIKEKYEDDIFNQIVSKTINSFTYIFNNETLYVYFNNIKEKAYINISLNLNLKGNDNHITDKKYIAFTFADGPGKYTEKILDTLNKYQSSATFLMLGSKMDKNNDIIEKIYESNSEIGSNGYYHKKSVLTNSELNNEYQTTNIIFNEITNDNIKIYSSQYEDYIEQLIEMHYPIIGYTIDSKDWLVGDTNKIYNNVIKNACDGCIVLFHDDYEDTADAMEKLIPDLNKLNYEVVSVSDLARIKNYNLNENKVITRIK